jgi:hypothetical protein
MITSAEFFAPLIVTLPAKGYPPQICKTEESAANEDFTSGKLLEELISLPPKKYVIIKV